MMQVRASARAKTQIVSQKYRQPADKVSTVVFIAATAEISPKNAVKHKRTSERLFGAPTLRSDLRSRFPVDRSFVEGNSFINFLKKAEAIPDGEISCNPLRSNELRKSLTVDLITNLHVNTRTRSVGYPPTNPLPVSAMVV
jgi:hypothetical protein